MELVQRQRAGVQCTMYLKQSSDWTCMHCMSSSMPEKQLQDRAREAPLLVPGSAGTCFHTFISFSHTTASSGVWLPAPLVSIQATPTQQAFHMSSSSVQYHSCAAPAGPCSLAELQDSVQPRLAPWPRARWPSIWTPSCDSQMFCAFSMPCLFIYPWTISTHRGPPLAATPQGKEQYGDPSGPSSPANSRRRLQHPTLTLARQVLSCLTWLHSKRIELGWSVVGLQRICSLATPCRCQRTM
jgi:hypothetical protein